MQDWLENEAKSKDYAIGDTRIKRTIPMAEITEALSVVKECPSKVMMVMEKMLMMPADELWKYSNVFLRHMNSIIDPSTPRQVMGELIAVLRLKKISSSNHIYFRTLQETMVRAEPGISSEAVGGHY